MSISPEKCEMSSPRKRMRESAGSVTITDVNYENRQELAKSKAQKKKPNISCEKNASKLVGSSSTNYKNCAVSLDISSLSEQQINSDEETVYEGECHNSENEQRELIVRNMIEEEKDDRLNEALELYDEILYEDLSEQMRGEADIYEMSLDELGDD